MPSFLVVDYICMLLMAIHGLYCFCLVSQGSRSFCSVNMEGQSNHDNFMQLMSSNVGGNVANDVPHVPGDDPNLHIFTEAGSSRNQTDALNIPWWIQTPEAVHNYVKFVAENSSFLPRSPSEEILESLRSPVTGTHAVHGASLFQRDMLEDKLGKSYAPKSTDSSLDIDAWKVMK